MVKLFLSAVALFGTYIGISKFAPQAWKYGIAIQGYNLTIAMMILMVVAFLCYKVKV